MNHLELYADRLPKHRRTWTFFTIILILVFVVLGQLVTILGLEKPLGFHSRDMDTNWMAMAIMLFGFAFGSVLVLIWVRLFERRPLKPCKIFLMTQRELHQYRLLEILDT